MSRTIAAEILLFSALALSSLMGCGTTKIVKQPGPIQKIEVTKYVALPKEHLKKCPIEYIKERSVEEAVRVLNANTAYLEKCAQQIIEINKLQPKEKEGST